MKNSQDILVFHDLGMINRSGNHDLFVVGAFASGPAQRSTDFHHKEHKAHKELTRTAFSNTHLTQNTRAKEKIANMGHPDPQSAPDCIS
jgi:hypothetical protein